MNNINININYITNFKPFFFKNFNKFKNKNKNKIVCRNFFLFLFLLKFINFNFNKIKIFIKPQKKKFYNILKAPYKNKLFKEQIGFSRYFIIFNFFINLNLKYYDNLNQFFYFFNSFLIFFKFLESNIIYNNKIRFFFNFKIIDYFKFK